MKIKIHKQQPLSTDTCVNEIIIITANVCTQTQMHSLFLLFTYSHGPAGARYAFNKQHTVIYICILFLCLHESARSSLINCILFKISFYSFIVFLFVNKFAKNLSEPNTSK